MIGGNKQVRILDGFSDDLLEAVLLVLRKGNIARYQACVYTNVPGSKDALERVREFHTRPHHISWPGGHFIVRNEQERSFGILRKVRSRQIQSFLGACCGERIDGIPRQSAIQKADVKLHDLRIIFREKDGWGSMFHDTSFVGCGGERFRERSIREIVLFVNSFHRKAENVLY